jgi:hypothetical protein
LGCLKNTIGLDWTGAFREWYIFWIGLFGRGCQSASRYIRRRQLADSLLPEIAKFLPPSAGWLESAVSDTCYIIEADKGLLSSYKKIFLFSY